MWSGRNGDFSATVYSGWLTRNPGKTNFTFGMMLNPPRNSGTDGGVLHWQSPDTASYEGNVVWKSMLNSNSTSLQTDWFITMDSLSFESGGNVNVSQSGELTTAVDPFESALIFPQAIAGAICKCWLLVTQCSVRWFNLYIQMVGLRIHRSFLLWQPPPTNGLYPVTQKWV